ncbi:RNA polymerase-associated protein RTF1 homolog [Drosophila elegans]|uniref:RNA polymerase-associated protein RTF1 homolog n=1 Tax=Drosophila elegans TaxID=30023 RepID=UPI0007E7FEB6|nr:RNA polymerase-associated protein RTF1 homolog [Drosophila elegans]
MSRQRSRRPAAEIVRELRRLRATPLRIDDEDESWAEGHERRPAPDVPLSSCRELEQLRLSRHRIGLLLVRPAFEQAVTGCFVRVNINGREELPDYRIAEVLGLGELDLGYQLEEVPTNVALRLRYEDLVVLHEIGDISNLAFTQEEFEWWRDNCVSQAISPPTTHTVARKKVELYNALQGEARALATIRRGVTFKLRPPHKSGIMERHGGVYPWRLQHPLPLIPPPPPMPPPANPPRGLTYRRKTDSLAGEQVDSVAETLSSLEPNQNDSLAES